MSSYHWSASFLSINSFWEENILQDLFRASRCWLWIDHSDSDLALRRQSPCFHHLVFLDVYISHRISGKHFTAQCSSEALSSVPLKEGGVSCHLLLLSATNLLLHSGKLWPISQWAAWAILIADCVGLWTLAFEKERSEKVRKIEVMQSRCRHRTFAREGTGGRRCESWLGCGTQGLERCCAAPMHWNFNFG